MERESIKNKICEMAFGGLGVTLSDGEEMRESGLDSLSLVMLIASMEEAFGISFSEDDLDPEQLITLDDLITLTERYL